MRDFCAQSHSHFHSSRFPIRKWASFAVVLGVLAFQAESAKAQDGSGPGNINLLPTIENFVAVNLGANEWRLQGQVVTDEPGGLTVTFSGVVNGGTVTQEDGTFSFTFTLDSIESGAVDALVVDSDGLSGSAETYVFNF